MNLALLLALPIVSGPSANDAENRNEDADGTDSHPDSDHVHGVEGADAKGVDQSLDVLPEDLAVETSQHTISGIS